MSMKFTPAASTRTKACPLPGAGVGISTSFITSGPPTDSIRMARMRPSRHFRSGSSRGSGLVPWQRADHRGAAGQPARPRAGLVPWQRADHRGAAGQPARPRAGLGAGAWELAEWPDQDFPGLCAVRGADDPLALHSLDHAGGAVVADA